MSPTPPDFPRDRLGALALRLLLCAAPPGFRREVGPDLVAAVARRAQDLRRLGGTRAATRYWVAQCADVARTLGAEWLDRLRPPHEHELRPAIPARETFLMDTVLADLRYSARTLIKQPAFSGIIVLTLALGIGASTAIFSILDAVVLQPLPYDDPDELVLISDDLRTYGISSAPLAPYEANTIFENARLFESFGASGGSFQAPLTSDDAEPEQIRQMNLSPGYLDMLGVRPILGRGFRPEEAEPVDPTVFLDPALEVPPSVALLDHDFWTRRYGADPAIIGQDITINSRQFEVIGVLPPGFRVYLTGLLGGAGGGGAPNQVYAPLQVDFTVPTGAGFLGIAARLADGVTIEQANAELEAIAADLRANHERSGRGDIYMSAASWGAEVSRDVRPALLALLGAVGFVLLIACANVANLLLARAASRRQEVAVRAALGARRGRIVRQVLTESLLLAAAGGGLGLLLSSWGVQALLTLQPGGMPRADSVSVNLTVLLFTAGATLVAVVLFGVVPAFNLSAVRGNLVLNERGTGGGSRGRSRFRSALVIAEVALSLVLLAGAGLTLRSFSHLSAIDPGFRPAGLETFQVALPFVEYRDQDSRDAFLNDALSRLERVSGVDSVAAATALPLSGALFAGSFYTQEMDTSQPGVEANYRGVVGGYFETMGTPLLQGREFDRFGDNSGQIVVDRQLAEHVFPGESAVGRILSIRLPAFPGGPPGQVEAEIIGVVGDVRDDGGLAAPSRRTIYLPYSTLGGNNLAFVFRTSVDIDQVLSRVREQIAAIDPGLPVYAVRPMQAYIDDTLAPVRFSLVLIGLFGIFALVLAAIGLYGVLSNSVRQQTRDIGVRLAFGASSGQILSRVVGRGAMLAGVGIAIGLVVAVPLTRALRSLFVGVAPTDPLTLGGISFLLLAVSVVACYLPALRASRLDPATSLRND